MTQAELVKDPQFKFNSLSTIYGDLRHVFGPVD